MVHVGATRQIVPTDAVTNVRRRPAVLVVRDDKAIPIQVRTGATGPRGIIVFGKLKTGEMVIRDAVHVSPYSDVSY